MKLHFYSVTLVYGLAFFLAGCAQTAQTPKQEVKPRATAENDAVIPSRFELHDIRNGNALSTGLLDKQTGRVWVLSGTREHPVARFEEVPVISMVHRDAQGNLSREEIDSTPLPRVKEPNQ